MQASLDEMRITPAAKNLPEMLGDTCDQARINAANKTSALVRISKSWLLR